ncbi:MAG: hypothetical protein Q8N31_16595 [Reyranella sp.]|nr:hypothetical protein [Reyranella sp.]MDP3161635.1 hypothetical protein [Reyranella sp.]
MKARHRYRVYGLVIESELRLTSVEEVADGDGEPAVTLGFAPPDYFRTVAPARATDPDDWVQHAVLGDGSVYMKADGAFETLISADGRTVTCGRLGDIDQRSFEANLLNFVMSASLTLQGEETLHSTVLDVDGRAVGLLGLSGAGKSTLAAFLISRGADLITDDMLRVKFADGSVLAYAGPYRLKLLDEPGTGFLPGAVADGFFNSLSGKIMVQPRAAVPRRRAPTPLAALFHLGHPDDQPTVGPAVQKVSRARLGGVELARVIISSTMDTRYARPDRLTRQIEFAARVAEALPVYELRYPRSVEAMDEVAAEIRRAIAA